MTHDGGTPIPGDEGFPDLVDAAFHNGHVTEAEWLERRKLHALVMGQPAVEVG